MNVPNVLSIFRILLVPVFILVFFSEMENARAVSVLIYAVAALTDVLDGMIARKYNLVTKLGRVLDPLADKLMAFSVLACIAVSGIVPMWAAVVIFVKEALMGVGALLIYKKTFDVLPADYFGKGATVVFFAVCVILILFEGIPKNTATFMISVALAITVLAFLNYSAKFIKAAQNGK